MAKGEGCEQLSPPGPERIMMVVPPLVVGHSLTHEQVMPFLKKLEHGQVREGMSNLYLTRWIVCKVVFFSSDVLKVLQDLDETSLHSVEILKHFVVCTFTRFVIVAISLRFQDELYTDF